MDNQIRFGPPNVCALYAEEKRQIAEMRKAVIQLKVDQQMVKQRLGRLLSRIDEYEKKVEELTLNEAKKSE
jgi:hypothetical protein